MPPGSSVQTSPLLEERATSRGATRPDAEASAPTRTESLRLQLADEIVSGLLEPGQALDEQELARRFGVSRTPVREAIRQLSASGLVQVRPHRSALVALPTQAQLHDMFEAMAELEALCAGLSARNMTAAERRALEAIHQELRGLVHQGDPLRYHERNEAFHGAIYAGTHNGYLADMTLMTRKRVAPFRRAQFRTTGRLGGSWQEHDMVVQAILRGDRQAATDAMRAHIGFVRDAFRSYAEAR